MIRIAYTFFLGLFLAMFVGMGVDVFYNEPKPPEEPTWYRQSIGKEGPNETQKKEEQQYLAAQKTYDKNLKHYNQNASIIILSIAVIILAIALFAADKLTVLADGVLLGGVFTLLYGIGRGIASDNNKFRFAVAAVGLVVTLVLGYFKFAKHHPATRR